MSGHQLFTKANYSCVDLGETSDGMICSTPISSTKRKKGNSPSSKSKPKEKPKSKLKSSQSTLSSAPEMANNGSEVISNVITRDKNLDTSFDEMDPYITKSMNSKLPYSKEEDEFIVKFVLKGENIFKVSSISLWKQLEYKKTKPKRTYQSLKNRFLRNIKPVLFVNFRHLIRNKESSCMILSKFPELKKQLRVSDTLSRIQIPIEKIPQQQIKPVESSIKKEKTKEKVLPVQSPKVSQTPSPCSSPNSPPKSPPKSPRFYRKVECVSDKIKITVNLNHPRRKKDNNPLPVLLNERFRKNKISFGPFVCELCGQSVGQPKRIESSGSETEDDIVIPSQEATNPLRPIPSTSKESPLRTKASISRKSPLLSVPSTSRASSVPTMPSTSRDSSFPPQTSSNSSFTTEISTPEKQKDIDKHMTEIFKDAMETYKRMIKTNEEKRLIKKYILLNQKAIELNFDFDTSGETTPMFTNNLRLFEN